VVLVSVCIPVYNMEGCIERAIRSALNQTYPEIEILVCDNRSSDRTYEVACSIKDRRLRVVKNEKNLGAYGNHNRCLKLAAGEWVKFLHGDDELFPSCVEEMTAVVRDRLSETALIGCGAIRLNERNQEIQKTFVPSDLFVMRAGMPSEFVLEGNIFGTPTMTMVHRHRLIRLGGFDLTMEPASDGDCWVLLRSHYPSVMMSRHLVWTRDDPPGSAGQQLKLVNRFCHQAFRQCEKWHRLDSTCSRLPLRKTFYGDWLIRETFRFWDATIHALFFGRLVTGRMLGGELLRHRLFWTSIVFYLKNRLKGRTAVSFRDHSWPVALSSLRIKDLLGNS